jgi:hypothetical protein
MHAREVRRNPANPLEICTVEGEGGERRNRENYWLLQRLGSSAWQFSCIKYYLCQVREPMSKIPQWFVSSCPL